MELIWSDDIIKYAIKIAKEDSNEPDDIEILIKEIADWLQLHSRKHI